MQTKNIRIGPGGFLLPYHHPAELANRVAMLDHISGGRLNFGVAAAGLPSDWAMFNVDGMSGVNRDMTREALDIILKLWSATEPFDYEGKYWNVSKPGEMFGVPAPAHQAVPEAAPADRRRRALQGLRHAEAGRRARLHADEPQPQPGLRRAATGNRSRSAPRKAGRTPTARDWRMVREVFVADTDEEAWRLSVGLHMGRMMREYFLPLLAEFGFLRVPQARPERGRHRRDPGVLRQAQLADRLARDRRREDRADLRRGRRLRPAAGVLLRLRREPARPGATRWSCWPRR